MAVLHQQSRAVEYDADGSRPNNPSIITNSIHPNPMKTFHAPSLLALTALLALPLHSQAAAESSLLDNCEIHGSWAHSSWYGWFEFASYPYVYHLEHGWQYVAQADQDGASVYDYGLASYLMVNRASYPWIYKYGKNASWYFYFQGGQAGNRWFALPAQDVYVQEKAVASADLSSVLVSAPEEHTINQEEARMSGATQVSPIHEAPIADTFNTEEAATASSEKDGSLSGAPGQTVSVTEEAHTSGQPIRNHRGALQQRYEFRP